MKNKNNLEMILSIVIAIVCVALYSFFPTNNIFEQLIGFVVFVFVIPMLYLKIILHKSLSDKSIKQGIFSQIILGLVLGVIIGVIISIVAFFLNFIPFDYKASIIIFKNSIGTFLLSELVIFMLEILSSIFIGYLFIKKILSSYKNNWIIAYVLTTLLLFTSEDKWFFGLIFIASAPILRKFKKDTFIILSTMLFFTILIFDTLIIKFII